MDEEKINYFSLFLRAGASVESGPPLSTILGNLGVNSVKFVKDYNDFTQDLSKYFLLVTNVIVKSDKSYSFSTKKPSTTQLLRLSTYKKQILVKGQGGYITKEIKVIRLKDIMLISFFTYGNCNDNVLKMIYGSIISLGIYIVEE